MSRRSQSVENRSSSPRRREAMIGGLGNPVIDAATTSLNFSAERYESARDGTC